MAESINSLYKGECIRREGPWRTVDYVELATLSWVHWWNTRRILEPIGEIPPIEFEAAYDRDRQAPSRKIAAPTLATTGSLRSNLSNTVELDNAPRTEPTFPTVVTRQAPKPSDRVSIKPGALQRAICTCERREHRIRSVSASVSTDSSEACLVAA